MKRQPCLLTGCLARRLRGFEFLRHEELEPGARRDGRTPQFVMAHNFKRSYFRLLLFVRVLIFLKNFRPPVLRDLAEAKDGTIKKS